MTDYKSTINLPQTGFPMKADLANRERKQLERWACAGYLRAHSRGLKGAAGLRAA